MNWLQFVLSALFAAAAVAYFSYDELKSDFPVSVAKLIVTWCVVFVFALGACDVFAAFWKFIKIGILLTR